MLLTRTIRSIRPILYLFCLCWTLSQVAWAGINTWTVDGPDGGDLRSLAVDPRDPDVVYAAASQGGFWKTTDGGDRWVSIQGDFIDINAQSVALHPEDPDVLLGLTNARLVRSVQGGPWTEISDQLDDFFFNGHIVFDHGNPDTLYLGSNNNGVLKSTDGGQTWAVLGPEAVSIAEFVSQDPNNAAILYTGGRDSNLFRSEDAGATWTDLGPVAPSPTGVQDLAVDPLNGNRLWAATNNGLYRSLDGGSTWELRDAGLGNTDMLMVRFDPRDPQTLFTGSRFGVGLGRSGDRGESWTFRNLNRQASAVEDIAFGAEGSGLLYLAVGRGAGFHRSLDDGETFQWASRGLAASTVQGIAVDPISGTVLATSGGNGVFRRDGLGNWQPLLNSPRNGRCCGAIVAVPGQVNTFYAVGEQGVYRTDDGGATWPPRRTGLPPFITSGRLVIDPSDGQRLFLPTVGGVHLTVDGGDLWTFSTEGLPGDEFIQDVAVDPQNGQILFAVADDRVYRSADGGGSWQPMTDDALDFRPYTLAINPLDTSNLLVGTPSDGVLRSVDGGVTWEDIGFSDNSFVRDVQFDDNGVALAVTFNGLWRTSGVQGQFWNPVGNPETISSLALSLAVERGPVATYYVGTSTGSAWSLTEGCISSDTVLCIDDMPGDRRFAISMDFETSQGGPQSGPAEVTVLEELGIRQGGVFSFFGRQNPEVLVKVLNGCAFNDRYWVFAAATTNVGYRLTVLDTRTGQSRIYNNQDGTIATTVTDTDALATCPQPGGGGVLAPPSVVLADVSQSTERSPEPRADKGVSGACQPDDNTLCIDDNPGDQRFAVRLSFDTVLGDGAAGDAMATSLSSLGVTDGGILSFFDVTNPEVLIKVINGCGFNDRYWVFYAAATNLGFRVEVEDTTTGFVWESSNPDGLPALTVTDTLAMDTCDG